MKLCILYEGPKDVEALGKRFIGWQVNIASRGKFAKVSINNDKGDSLGDALIMKFPTGHWTIANIEATGSKYRSNKWGPMIYDIIMEYATLEGKGLVPAEMGTMYFRNRVKYNDNMKDLLFGSIEDMDTDVDLLNFTSPDAKKHYSRMFNSGKGLYGQPIDIESITEKQFLEKGGPSSNYHYFKGTELENMPYRGGVSLQQQPTQATPWDTEKWLNIIGKMGGFVQLFRRDAQAKRIMLPNGDTKWLHINDFRLDDSDSEIEKACRGATWIVIGADNNLRSENVDEESGMNFYNKWMSVKPKLEAIIRPARHEGDKFTMLYDVNKIDFSRLRSAIPVGSELDLTGPFFYFSSSSRYRETPFLWAAYSKEPYILGKLEEAGLLNFS